MAISQCKICGKDYEVCNSCLNQKTFKPWRTVVDSIEHYKIYLAIHGYSLTKNKNQAKEELENCDLSDLEKFNPAIKNTIKEILAEPKITTETKRKKKNENFRSYTKTEENVEIKSDEAEMKSDDDNE